MYKMLSSRTVVVLLVGMALLLAVACGSSDEDTIVFVSTLDGDEEIVLLDPDNGNVLPLTNNRSRDFNPRISPDGKTIAYLSDQSGDVEINSVNRKGETIRLTHNVVDDQFPLWAPDGHRLAFISSQHDNPEIYLMATNGDLQTRVTSNDQEDHVGDWSPDGEWLVIYRDADDEDKGLWLRNPDGVNLVRLTEHADSSPAWSPDGNQILFVREGEENSDIYSISRLKNGSWQDEVVLTRLTSHQAADISPVWSPDSETIAFVSFRSGNAEIYIMSEDGSSQSRLTNNEADDFSPVWSPDGKRIAFVSYLYGPGEIIVMAADGSRQRRLTNNTAEDNSPDW